jgi:hypothetical protein
LTKQQFDFEMRKMDEMTGVSIGLGGSVGFSGEMGGVGVLKKRQSSSYVASACN